MTSLSRRQVVWGLGSACFTGALVSMTRASLAAGTIKIDDKSALIVVEVQNCFLPGGSLAVKDGEQVIPVINRIAKGFANVVMTQDWHTPDHVSFASAHAGKKAFDVINLRYGDQVLWPDHCVQGTAGADIGKDIAIPQAELVIRKGYHKDMDRATRRSWRPITRRRPAWTAISSSAACRRCSLPASPPIFASPGPPWMRGASGSPPT